MLIFILKCASCSHVEIVADVQLHFAGNLNIQNNHPPIDVSEKMSAEEKISLRKMILRMEMMLTNFV